MYPHNSLFLALILYISEQYDCPRLWLLRQTFRTILPVQRPGGPWKLYQWKTRFWRRFGHRRSRTFGASDRIDNVDSQYGWWHSRRTAGTESSNSEEHHQIARVKSSGGYLQRFEAKVLHHLLKWRFYVFGETILERIFVIFSSN